MTMRKQPEGLHRVPRGEERPAQEYDIFKGKMHIGHTQRAKQGWFGFADGVTLAGLPEAHKTHGDAMLAIHEAWEAAQPQPSAPAAPPVPDPAPSDGPVEAVESEHVEVIPVSDTSQLVEMEPPDLKAALEAGEELPVLADAETMAKVEAGEADILIPTVEVMDSGLTEESDWPEPDPQPVKLPDVQAPPQSSGDDWFPDPFAE